MWTMECSNALEHVSCGFPQHLRSSKASRLVYDALSNTKRRILNRGTVRRGAGGFMWAYIIGTGAALGIPPR